MSPRTRLSSPILPALAAFTVMTFAPWGSAQEREGATLLPPRVPSAPAQAVFNYTRHSATLLPSGDLLVVGGYAQATGSAVAAAVIANSKTGVRTATRMRG